MRTSLKLISFLLWLALNACTASESEELPQFAVALKLGGSFTPGGEVALTAGWVVVGDMAIYGMDAGEAGYLLYAPSRVKHAGHAHGEAEFETAAPETFLVDLLAAPQVVADNMLTEAHYFDGKLRLRPLSDLYSPQLADGTPVTAEHPLWGETLALFGRVTLDGTQVPFEIRGAVEALVTGIEYGGTVTEGGAVAITTAVDLDAVLAGIEWASATRDGSTILISEEENPDLWLTVKAALKLPSTWLHLEAEPPPEE